MDKKLIEIDLGTLHTLVNCTKTRIEEEVKKYGVPKSILQVYLEAFERGNSLLAANGYNHWTREVYLDLKEKIYNR